MDDNFELEFSDSETEQPRQIKPTEEIVTEYKIRKLPPKAPKKRVLTAKQLETSRANLQKAREKRAFAALQKKEKEKAAPPKKSRKYEEVYDSYSDESDYESDDYEPEPPKRSIRKKADEREKPAKMTKAEQKMMLRMEKIEDLIGQLASTKAPPKKPRSVHKTVIVNPPAQQYIQPHYGSNPSAQHARKDLMDIFN